MGTKIHMCMNVRGFLSNRAFPSEYVGMFIHDDGTLMEPTEARNALYDELSKGHEVIPWGECDNFDFSGPGCKGHIEG